MVMIEYLANDYADAEDGNGVAEYRDNMGRLFDLLLRWGQADVVAVLPNPYGKAGDTRHYDGYVANLLAAANARNLFVADVYDPFLALPESTLLSYYLEPSVDHAHLTEAGCAFWAKAAGDAIVSALAAPAPLPPATGGEDGGGDGGGCGATGAEAAFALAALILLRARR
jgi:uncharacterized protein (TIGR03382 family)